MNNHSEQNRNEKVDKANRSDMADKMEPTPIKAAQTVPSPGAKVKWPQQVKAAKSQWSKLSESEILKSDGNQQQLSALVQQRYHIEQHVADKQVKTFLEQQNKA
ncbi:hypothetical protein [Lacimicrobium sp. SS2-24]|uniref:CsbD family protein n=1 Tax=Lacimicrobium sp. SS2-24 TaxID=2005569 RepID=UPI001AEFBC54|nr:hypothetical protein [Lacimicrobium sp. SS2-24]